MKYKIFTISKPYSHIYYFLKDQGLSERFISSLRKERGNILLNEQTANTKSPLKIGDNLKIALETKEKSSFKSLNVPLDIIYEDEYILAINKPANLPTSASKSHYDNNLSGAILGYMKEKDPNFVLRIINRLDKDTGGIVLVAKDIFTYTKLGKIDKKYHAVCVGEIDKDIIIDKPIETVNKNGINEIKRVISENGKEATTFVRPLKKLKDMTLIELTLKHGRTHQIRVHLSSISHPLVGDSIYGEKSKYISHTALVCKEVSFTHPITQKNILLTVDYPLDFLNLITL